MVRIACEEVCHCLVQLSAAGHILGFSGYEHSLLAIYTEGSTRILEREKYLEMESLPQWLLLMFSPKGRQACRSILQPISTTGIATDTHSPAWPVWSEIISQT